MQDIIKTFTIQWVGPFKDIQVLVPVLILSVCLVFIFSICSQICIPR